MTRCVLLIGLPAQEGCARAPVLARSELRIVELPDRADAVELVTSTRWDVIVMADRDAQDRRASTSEFTTEDLLLALRNPRSASRNARAVIQFEGPNRERARRLVARGANQIVVIGPNDTLQDAVAIALEVSPRVHQRVPVRLRVKALVGPLSATCNTVDLSKTGLLLECNCRYAPGAKVDFEIDLPDDPRSCSGVAEVVRVATRESDGLVGFALHFQAFADDGRARLESFVATRMAEMSSFVSLTHSPSKPAERLSEVGQHSQ